MGLLGIERGPRMGCVVGRIGLDTSVDRLGARHARNRTTLWDLTRASRIGDAIDDVAPTMLPLEDRDT